MSESEETLPPSEDEPNPNLPDWYLQGMVDLVNGNDVEFPITLFVRGLIVSGQLTSGHNYFEGLANQLKEFFGELSDGTTKAVEYLTAPRKLYTGESGSDSAIPPQYIHIRNAKVFAPGQHPIPSEGSWWRGRVSSIDAFHFGSLGINTEANA